MNFLQLIEQLARRVGPHQIPLHAAAQRLQGLVDSSALHYKLMTQIVQAIYAGNGCRKLTDTVQRDATFEALAPIRLAVLRAPDTDVDAARLLEDIGVALAQIFGPTDPGGSHTTVASTPRSATLVTLRRPRRGSR
jgi:hypothetical protein